MVEQQSLAEGIAMVVERDLPVGNKDMGPGVSVPRNNSFCIETIQGRV